MRMLLDRWQLYIGLEHHSCEICEICEICAYKFVHAYFLFERLWVVNPETQSDEWVVNVKSWVVNSYME